MALDLVRYSLDGTSGYFRPDQITPEPQEIPIPRGLPLFRMRVTLTERDYDLRFDWNGRTERWYFTLTSGDTVVARGRKVVCAIPLLEDDRWKPMCPPGMLLATDFSDQGGAPPRFSDLGTRVRLFYYEPPAVADTGDLFALA